MKANLELTNSGAPITLGVLVAVTVTFNPDLAILEQQLQSLQAVDAVVVVDNGSRSELIAGITLLIANTPWVHLIANDTNVGLAAALNRGISEARLINSGVEAVLLLDQDSLFSPETPRYLLAALNAVQEASGTLCCVGPALIDTRTGAAHGFHHITGGWRWARMYPAQDSPAVSVVNLNGSGTTMPIALVDAIGGLDEALFIDHVDTEWAFRAMFHGAHLYGIPWLAFEHNMGEKVRRIWFFSWRVWPERSPLRHYYLFRNTVRLIRRPYVPKVWKGWALVKLIVDTLITTAIDTRRGQQLRMMYRGFVEGWRNL